MSREPESKRLVDSPEESPEVRALLVAGATDEIDYDFDRGLASHLGTITALPVPSTPGWAASGSAKSAALLSSKAWLAVAAVSVAIASAAVALLLPGAKGTAESPDAHQAAPARARASVDPLSGAPLGAAAEALLPVPAPIASSASSTKNGPAHPLPAQAGDIGRAAAERASRAAPLLPGVPAERLTLAETPESPPAGMVPLEGAPAAGAPVASEADPSILAEAARAETARVEAARALGSDRLKREMDSLVLAKRVLASDPARALSVARDAERDFPNGLFAEEREHLMILALISLGRMDEAKRRAAPYLAAHPDSPFARRVRGALDTAAAHSAR